MITNEEKILTALAEIKRLLEENRKIMTVEQAANFLNMKKSYLYKIINTIPHSQPNDGKIYFDRDDLIKWAMSAKKLPPAEQAEKMLKNKGT